MTAICFNLLTIGNLRIGEKKNDFQTILYLLHIRRGMVLVSEMMTREQSLEVLTQAELISSLVTDAMTSLGATAHQPDPTCCQYVSKQTVLTGRKSNQPTERLLSVPSGSAQCLSSHVLKPKMTISGLVLLQKVRFYTVVQPPSVWC